MKIIEVYWIKGGPNKDDDKGFAYYYNYIASE